MLDLEIKRKAVRIAENLGIELSSQLMEIP